MSRTMAVLAMWADIPNGSLTARQIAHRLLAERGVPLDLCRDRALYRPQSKKAPKGAAEVVLCGATLVVSDILFRLRKRGLVDGGGGRPQHYWLTDEGGVALEQITGRERQAGP